MREKKNPFRDWLLDGLKPTKETHKGPNQEHHQEHHQDSWWKVMCLTGVDYFSTLGYQPGIAYLAAGILSPLATLVLVVVTLFGALPAYCFVAERSPNGQGSVAMLEGLLPGWRGKTIVLLLLGFAATGFIITITLSAADATAHILENPMIPAAWHNHNRVLVTLLLLTSLGAVFLKGFKEAIGISVYIVGVYLLLTNIIVGWGLWQLTIHPELTRDWLQKLSTNFGSIFSMLGAACLLFPNLALGLSGFETGVAVMPMVRGDASDVPENQSGRIRNAKYLLTTAALIMSYFLVASSMVTTLLIPAELYKEGGAANGRALAYLAHTHLGELFGTLYDFSTILILWFAGASAIAGLLSLVPRYLPRYGMAPDWAGAVRPLVIFFTLIAYGVTLIFKADVDAQAGAYATGVLVLITSAALASAITSWQKGTNKRFLFTAISLVFIWTSIVNMTQRPEGVRIALFFVVSILIGSLVSRALRSTELRVEEVKLDKKATEFITAATHEHWGEVRLLANRAGTGFLKEKEARAREVHSIQAREGNFIFLEVEPEDVSEFSDKVLEVTGHEIDGYHILRCKSLAVPNAIAAVLLHLRDKTKKMPHVYFGWTEGHPIIYTFKFIFFGEGETATLTREIIRSTEANEFKRPLVHVA
ncbi:MAG: amino acid transporter [Candidatus Melainabacteria bacterium]|nr:amino acid transporter [Candidatus Melainabacteria bacterium]